MTITLPKPRMRARLWGIFGILFLLGCMAALVNWALPPLITDIAVRDTAIAVRGRVESGKCHSKLIFHICDVTLVNAMMPAALISMPIAISRSAGNFSARRPEK